MKKILIIMLGIIMLFATSAFVACEVDDVDTHVHTGGIATCNEKAKCDECGEEYGEFNSENHASTELVYVSNGNGTHKIAHKCCNAVTQAEEVCAGGEATCEEKAKCEKCDGEYGEFGEHTGGTPTCNQKAVCSDCGKEYGEFDATNHASTELVYVSNGNGKHNKVHKCCNAIVEENLECTGGLATCIQKAKCKDCGGEYGTFGAHKGGTATCAEKAECDVCHEKYGDLNAQNHASEEFIYTANNNGTHNKVHKCCNVVAVENENCSGGTATCQLKAKCKNCGATYGDFGAHNYTKDGKDAESHWKECSVCDTRDENSVTAHSATVWETTENGEIGKCECGEIVTTIIENVSANEINLYTIANLGENDYSIEETYSPVVTVNGVSLTINISSDDEDVAIYEGGKIKAVKAGKTVITITYTLPSNRGEVKKTFDVNVIRPVVTDETAVSYFSAIDGWHEYLTELFGQDAITEAKQTYKGEDYVLTFADGKLSGMFTESKTSTVCSLTICTETYGYVLSNVTAYTKVINTVEDLVDMRLTAERKTVEGYFIMNADLDLWNADINGNGDKCSVEGNDTFYPYNGGSKDMLTVVNDNTRADAAAGFIGTFDGNGHTITGFRAGNSYGFFGTICGKRTDNPTVIEYTTVKNVAFLNTHIFWTSWTVGKMFAEYAAYTQIENVYIQFARDNTNASTDNKNFALFGSQDSPYVKMKNVVLNYDMTFSTDTLASSSGSAVGIFAGAANTNYYAGAGNTSSIGYMLQGSIEGLYVIAPKAENGRVMPLVQHGNYTLNSSTSKWELTGSMTIYAANDFVDFGEKSMVTLDETTRNPILAESGAHYVYHWKNAYRYDTLADMAEANSKVGNWKVSASGVVWEA